MMFFCAHLDFHDAPDRFGFTAIDQELQPFPGKKIRLIFGQRFQAQQSLFAGYIAPVDYFFYRLVCRQLGRKYDPHAHFQRAHEYGVRRFAFDTRIELEKLANLAPGAQVIGRVAVDNNGSHWPLERKFGIEPGQEVEHFLYARALGLEPYGLTFHVGSQNSDPQAWVRALERLSPIWNELEARGIQLQVIDTGGGFPVQFNDPVPGVEEIAAAILPAMQRLFGNKAKLLVEPGRGLVGNTGIMAATVINRATRGEREWLYLDVGAFQGLIEMLDFYGFNYPVISERNSEPLTPFVLSGPTCDSADVIKHQAMLPAGITLGDRVYVLTAGAYSNSMERYNGIDFPETIIVQKELVY